MGDCESKRTDKGRHEESLSKDTICSLLARRYRRDLLRYLGETPGCSFTLEECVVYIIDREKGRGGERPSYNEIKTVLHHIHFPKLSDTGVLAYDTRHQEIRYYGHEQLEGWLARLKEDPM